MRSLCKDTSGQEVRRQLFHEDSLLPAGRSMAVLAPALGCCCNAVAGWQGIHEAYSWRAATQSFFVVMQAAAPAA